MTKRQEAKLREELENLQRRYDAAKRLGRRLEMARHSRRMIEINLVLLKSECPRRRRAA
jgi:hypothetical protein